MSRVDIILFVLLALFVWNGYRKGFVIALGQLLGAVAGFLAARQYADAAALWLSRFIHWPKGILYFVGFLLVFILVERLFGLVMRLLNYFIKILSIIPFLSTINGLLGAILSLIEGFLLVGSSAYIIKTLQLDPRLLSWVAQSKIAAFAEPIFSRAYTWIASL